MKALPFSSFTLVIGLLLLFLSPYTQAQTLMVTNLADSGPGTLRQLVSNAIPETTIIFTNTFAGATITLTNGQIFLSNDITIDASALTGGIQINGNASSRIFQVYTNVNVTLNSLTITNGKNDFGGAIYNDGTMTFNLVTLSGNMATNVTFDAGGAIFNDSPGVITLNQCTFSGNMSTEGGAMENFIDGMVTLNECTFSGNSVTLYGGAIENYGGVLVAILTTFSLNHATGTSINFTGGGAIDNYDSTLNLQSCILAGNTDAADTAPDLWEESGPLAANNCLIGDGKNSDLDGGNDFANQVGTGAAPINPLLAPLGNYGGSTQTMPPLPGSPAIDTGDNDDASGFTTDQRGYPRIAGTAVDIGAVEGVYIATGPGRLSGATRLNDGTVQLTFTNYTDASFPVLAATNLSQTVSNWIQIGFTTENPAGSGQFQFTDTQATNYPQRFYRLRSP